MAGKVIHAHRLEQAKVNFKSQLLFNQDGATNSAIDIARQVFHLGRRVPLAEAYARIDDIDQNNMYEVLNHYVCGRYPVISLNGNFYPFPGYDWMCHMNRHKLSSL